MDKRKKVGIGIMCFAVFTAILFIVSVILFNISSNNQNIILLANIPVFILIIGVFVTLSSELANPKQ